ncbi:hypothetical protein ABW20_dc0106014 [Dactylellina cionopaga]|nr:hypothetical protein ABW20_dc0106014 [Dactylellina cionopaga]
MGGEAFYLINATDGSLNRSGMAFYSNEDVVNSQGEPDAYVEIQSDGNITWEGTYNSGVFPNTDNFRVCIVGNAQQQAPGSTVGIGRNNNRAWNVYRNDGKVAWTKNGWTYHAIYSCE